MSWRTPRFWYEAPATSLKTQLLAPLGRLYGAEVRRRLGSAVPIKAPCPVICIGNATLGGVGKTPLVAWLTRALRERGHEAAVLTRGYGGQERGPCRVPEDASAAVMGDEAVMLAQSLPVYLSADRAAGAKFAVGEGAGVLVMDDGLQNPSIHKDLSLLAVDTQSMFGNDRLFPAGPLRERPEEAADRCAAILAIGRQDAPLPERLTSLAGAKPLFRASFVLDDALPTGPHLAFCGIGRPERFRASLKRAGAELVGFEAFADHHAFAASELDALRSRAAALGAELITTEKDYARLAPADRSGINPVRGTMRVADPDGLLTLVEEVL